MQRIQSVWCRLFLLSVPPVLARTCTAFFTPARSPPLLHPSDGVSQVNVKAEEGEEVGRRSSVGGEDAGRGRQRCQQASKPASLPTSRSGPTVIVPPGHLRDPSRADVDTATPGTPQFVAGRAVRSGGMVSLDTVKHLQQTLLTIIIIIISLHANHIIPSHSHHVYRPRTTFNRFDHLDSVSFVHSASFTDQNPVTLR